MNAIEVVEAAYAAVLARDEEALLARFAADCRFEDVAAGTVAVGRESLREYMAEQWTAVPDFHVERARLLSDGASVAAELVLGGRHAGEFLGVPPSGRTVAWRAAAFYEVRLAAAEITSETYYYDSQALLAELR